MFNELAKGVALLLSLCFLHGLSMRMWRNRPLASQVSSGMVFGCICLVGMLQPFMLMPGVIIDARSVVLSMAGLFGGPVVACIAAIMAIGGRISLGGAGVQVGIIGIIVCSSLGLLYHWGRGRGQVQTRPRQLLMFGLIVHLTMGALFQMLPLSVTSQFNQVLALPYLITFAAATVAMGYLLLDVENRLATERALTESAARLRAITRAIPDVLLVLDRHGNYVEVLSSDEKALAAPAADLLGRNIYDILPTDDGDRFIHSIQATLRTRQCESMEYAMHTLSGLRTFEGRSYPLGVKVQGQDAVVFLARDITERKQAEQALRESEMRFRSLLLNIPSISVQGYLADGTTTYWNKASERLYGYRADEALSRNIFELVIPPQLQDSVRAQMRTIFHTGQATPAGEFKLQRKDGSLVDVLSSRAYIQVPGQPAEMFCIDIDISDRKAAENEARYLAFYDALTQLPNRRLLADRLQHVISQSARNGLITAVLFIDLDNFKTLNDTRGHEVGDQLLVDVAKRLCSGVREHDTVARLGGDEFVVVLQNLSADLQEASAQTRARGELLLAQVNAPYDLGGYIHHCSASMGAALLTDPHVSVDDALKRADMAMYYAKDAGRNTLRFFDPDMQQAVNRRAALEAQMHQGLEHGQFLLLYQPQVNARGQWTGAEVLVRWQHPTQGIMSPLDFIPLAEETGIIVPLGLWVIETALRQQARWQNDPALAHLQLSINVSARQFHQDDFVARILHLLRTSGARSARIQLELTESILLHQVDAVAHTMQTLKSHGLRFALDDFGTGYSSLSYLKRLPLDLIKIDQSFVRDALVDTNDTAIAGSIIALARSLGMAVIAEGVETQAHHGLMLSMGCDAFQGYYFGRPLTLTQFEAQARRQRPRLDPTTV